MEKKPGVKKIIGESFSERAEKYGTSADHVRGTDLDYIQAFLKGKSFDVALDVSTGAGHTAGLLKAHGMFVLALDIASGMLWEAAARYGGGNIGFVRGDAEQLPFPAEVFSLVTCRIAPHHFPHVPSFLEEVKRVLRQKGFFLLVDSTAPEDDLLDAFLNRMEEKRDGTHVRSLRISEWERLLGAAGFRVADRKVFRKRHDFRQWVERTSPGEKRERELEEMVGRADERIREYFQFEFEDGEICSYTDDKTLFLSVKG